MILFYHVSSSFSYLLTYNFFFPVVFVHFFNSTAELALPTVISTKQAKGEIETHPVTVEAKISSCSI